MNITSQLRKLGRLVLSLLPAYSSNVATDQGIAGHTPARCSAITGNDSPCDNPDVPMGNAVTVRHHMGPRGATVFGLNFNSPDLQALLARVPRSECIPIRMDPADTSTIYVRDADAWLAVPCVTKSRCSADRGAPSLHNRLH